MNTNTTTTHTADTTATRPTFDELKRTFETAYTTGADCSAPLLNLATALAVACVNKCIDPQRKTAGQRDTISDNGNSPALLNLRRGIYHDLRLLDNTARNAAAATRTTYNADGDAVTETADTDARDALSELIEDTLSDGLDLVNTAAAALLEQAAAHADGGTEWLDKPYTVRRLARKVYIRADDSAAYRDDTTTPIQEAYREVRRAIQSSRAVQTDPRNGYTYIEDTTPDGLDTILFRQQKYADLGGYNMDGNYTADIQTARDYNATLAALNLSDRQLSIVNLRMRGYGLKAIATYLGVTRQAVQNALAKIQKKCEKIGFTPAMWAEMCEN